MKIYFSIAIISIFTFSKSILADTAFMNISGNDIQNSASRTLLLNNSNKPGIRLAWEGMKEMNKEFKPGTVDISIKEFEDNAVKLFNTDFKKQHPEIKVDIMKTDFKGYQIYCKPMPSCLEATSNFVKKLPPGNLIEKDKDGKVIKTKEFNHVSASGKNYKEGYIKARASSAYSEFSKLVNCEGIKCKKVNLEEFIDQEMKKALREATGIKDITKIPKNDPIFQKNLKELIELTRAGKEIPDSKKHLLKFKPLVKALDTLLETPFTNSNNLDDELKNAVKNKVKLVPPKKYALSTAISGDDLFVIIKDKDGNIVKVVGADAKGLGVTNMTTRLDQVLDQYKNNGKINSMNDVFDLSKRATDNADITMDKSIKQYIQTIEESLNSPNTNNKNLTNSLERAHKKYHGDTLKPGSSLMQMRTAVVPHCGKSNQCLMDNITVIHNLLKKMEMSGHNGHFGDSCIGIHFWLKKMKIKSDI